MPGLYWHRITDEAGKRFFEDTWKVAPEADRIGYRFRGGRAARVRTPPAAVRRGLRSLQHRRQLLSLWLDPGAGRHGADRPASRRRVGRRLFHARHRDLRRHGPDRPVAAASGRALRQASTWTRPSPRARTATASSIACARRWRERGAVRAVSRAASDSGRSIAARAARRRSSIARCCAARRRRDARPASPRRPGRRPAARARR